MPGEMDQLAEVVRLRGPEGLQKSKQLLEFHVRVFRKVARHGMFVTLATDNRAKC